MLPYACRRNVGALRVPQIPWCSLERLSPDTRDKELRIGRRHDAPLCLPDAAYARDLPKAVVAFRTEHEADPFFGWVVETYGRYRHRDV